MLVVVVMVGLPTLCAFGEEGAKGQTEGRPAVRGPAPELVLTAEQQAALKVPVEALTKALKDLQEVAIKQLGERDGARFVMQLVRKNVAGTMRGPPPEGRKPGKERPAAEPKQ